MPSTPDFGTASNAVLGHLRGVLGFEMAAVARKEGDVSLLLHVDDACYGLRAGDVLPWPATPCALALAGAIPRFVPDAAEEPDLAAAGRDLGLRIGAFLSYPLHDARGDVVGTVWAASRTPRAEGQRTADPALEPLTDMLASVLHVERCLLDDVRRRDLLRAEDELDPLTNLGNRRLWDRVLAAEEDRCRRYGLSAIVVVTDVDDLRGCNAAQGHAAGDALLREVAAQLQRLVRETDAVVRLGGDEFGVLLTDCRPALADGLVARLVGQLAAANVAVSLGWAVRAPDGSLAQAWADADARMAINKRERRGEIQLTAPRSLPLAVVDEDTREDVASLLRLARTHLDLPVAFVAQAEHGRHTVTHVDGEGALAPGTASPALAGWCRRLIDGGLPPVIPATDAHPVASTLEGRRSLGIGSIAGVPITLPDGGVHGTLCIYGPDARGDLNERDVAFLRTIAEAIARRLDRHERERRERHRVVAAIDVVLGDGRLEMAFQPVVELATGDIFGYEALARFRTEPYRTPDVWFADASSVGMGTALEHHAVRIALESLPQFAGLLGINVSPAAIVAPGFRDLFADVPLDRVVIELTEHEAIGDYAALHAALGPLRARGARLAVDDVGAGVANLSHVVRLAPDTVKLDRGLVDGIADDPARQAMAAAMATFAARTGADAVAEGIETEADRRAVADLGVAFGQGWLLGRPGPLPEVSAAADAPVAPPTS